MGLIFWKDHESKLHSNSSNVNRACHLITDCSYPWSPPSLDLPRLRLCSLPPQLSSIARIKRLTVEHNCLRSLPPGIKDLSLLEHLSLRGNIISRWPEVLSHLSSLQHLDLSKNRLSSVHKSIGELSKLQVLALDGNQLSHLPPEIGNLKELEILWLPFNHLQEIPLQVMTLSNVHTLSLDFNELTSLPLQVGDADFSIPNFSAHGNRSEDLKFLCTFPEDDIQELLQIFSGVEGFEEFGAVQDCNKKIERMINLRLASMRVFSDKFYSKISGFDSARAEHFAQKLLYWFQGSAGFRAIQNLSDSEERRFDLISAYSKLSSSEVFFSKKPAEEEEEKEDKGVFQGAEKALKRTSDAIFHAFMFPKQLQDLNLSGLQLSSLNRATFLLFNISCLDLRNNNLGPWFEEFRWVFSILYMPNLEQLHLNASGISDFPKELMILPKLQWSSLLEGAPSLSLSELQKWRKEEIGRLKDPDQKKSVDETVWKIADLFFRNVLNPSSETFQILNLSRANFLNSLPPLLGKFDFVSELRLSGGRLKNLENVIEKMDFLKTIFVDDVGFEAWPESLQKISQLEILDISENRIKSVSGNPVFPLLVRFQASKNQFTEIPEAIFAWEKLQFLDLGFNLIGRVPENISYSKEIRELYLNNNNLRSIPAVLSELEELEILRLDHNQLSSLPYQLGNLKKLKLLNVYDNHLLVVPKIPNLDRISDQIRPGHTVSKGFIVGKNHLLYKPSLEASLQKPIFWDFLTGEDIGVSPIHHKFVKLFAAAQASNSAENLNKVMDYYNKFLAENLTVEEAALQFLASSLVYLEDKFGEFSKGIVFNVKEDLQGNEVNYYASRYKILNSIKSGGTCNGFYLVPQSSSESHKAKIIVFCGTKFNAIQFPKKIPKSESKSKALVLPSSFLAEIIKSGEKIGVSEKEQEEEIKLVITGHSYGGFLAVQSFANIENSIHRQKNAKLVTFNAPGVEAQTIDKMCAGISEDFSWKNSRIIRHEFDIAHLAGEVHCPGIVLYTNDLIEAPMESVESEILSTSPDLAAACKMLTVYAGFYARKIARGSLSQVEMTSLGSSFLECMGNLAYAHTVPSFALRQMHGLKPLISRADHHSAAHMGVEGGGFGREGERVQALAEEWVSYFRVKGEKGGEGGGGK